MKVNQIVGEHKKGFRAKKYARKPTNTVAPKKPEPIKPQGPVSAGQDVKETANVTVKPVVGAQEVDVNGQKIATATDATAAQTIAQLAKDGKIAVTPPGSNTSTSTPMEEGPEVPYYVELGPNGPMAKTAPKPTTIVASKLWQAITPEIEAKAGQQGFRKVLLQANNKQYVGLEGGDQRLGSKIIVSPADYQALSAPAPAAAPARESAELDSIRKLAGL